MTIKQKRNWFAAIQFIMALATIATVFTPAVADELSDVSKAMQTGQYAEAMQKADAFLAQHPKDAHMRFMKGLIFAEQNKTTDAINVFTKLTEDYPDLPEPYNNLAVLFASINQYDKARAALEMAIRTNPSYSTAHENLGDIYAKMASQAYDKALQLDSGNSGAKLKLNLIHNLFSNTSSAINNTASAKTPAPAPAAKTAAAPAPTKPVEVAVATPAAKPAPAKAEVIKPAPAKAAPATNSNQEELLKLIEAWATAWSNKNTNAYLAFYASDFQTPKGESKKAWSEERRARIESKGHINVKIDSPKISIDGSTATIKFRQIYSSDQLKADSRKTLVLSKQDGKWQIIQERSGG